jgi:hypothetical protein
MAQISLGGIAPGGDDWLAAKLRDLERRTAQSGNAMTISGQPGITIQDGATVRVYASSGDLVAAVGQYADSDGVVHNGVVSYRPDGSEGLHVDEAGFAGIFDKNGTVVLSDDFKNGGLATPHIPLTLGNADQSQWPQTTAGTWTTIARRQWERQQPYLSWYFILLADSGVTAQYRLLVNGNQVGTTQTVVSTGSSVNWLDKQQITDTIQPRGVVADIELQAQITAGAGAARAFQEYLTGDQSP